MKCLLFVTVAVAGIAGATPIQAQARFDVCAAYARDAMMAFYSSSAVPVPRAERAWEGVMERRYWPRSRDRSHDQRVGSIRFYLNRCLSGNL